MTKPIQFAVGGDLNPDESVIIECPICLKRWPLHGGTEIQEDSENDEVTDSFLVFTHPDEFSIRLNMDAGTSTATPTPHGHCDNAGRKFRCCWRAVLKGSSDS
jgi:hypothetical protein